jgi:hypothetical protein
MPDGTYVVVDGPGVIAQKTVTFAAGAGSPTMAIEGCQPVRWLGTSLHETRVAGWQDGTA